MSPADSVAVLQCMVVRETLSEYFTALFLLHRRNNAESRIVTGTERHENHLVMLFCLMEPVDGFSLHNPRPDICLP